MTHSLLGLAPFLQETCEKGACRVVFSHVGDVGLLNVLARVTFLGQLKGLVAKHVLVHVALLQLDFKPLDFIRAVLLDLLVFKIALKHKFGTCVLLTSIALHLCFVFDRILIFCKSELHVKLSNFVVKLFLLGSLENFSLNLKIFFFLDDTGLF